MEIEEANLECDKFINMEEKRRKLKIFLREQRIFIYDFRSAVLGF